MADAQLALEHRIVKPIKTLGGGAWLLAISGGLDSMVMAEVLFRWSRLLKIDLRVGHVHHGKSDDDFRDRAQALVRRWCEVRQIPFFTNPAEENSLKSEAEWRALRRHWLAKWSKKAAQIVLAHHRDDLLETRVLRLIRGTGAEGLEAMRLRRGRWLRPMLECSRQEIATYAEARGVEFVEDPTNADPHALRNWLRHDWLPRLEKRQPGSLSALARSLEILATPPVELSSHVGLRRDLFTEFSSAERERMVAGYLRGLGLKNYGRSHVREILKRVDSRQKNITFEMLGVVFRVTPDLFWASRV